ncbi:MAG TPA: IclR family transcriptional regulator [Xanthobacteraceae bacterium]|nr:IclR family transcriptional regulator [Xanthobacteraceae bacterium]
MAVRPLSSSLKTLAVCDVVATSPTPLRLADVVRETGDRRAVVYQRLRTLVQAGFLEQSADGQYRLGLRFHSYAARALEQAGLGDRCGALLQEVVGESGETASLSVLDGDSLLIVGRVETHEILRADLRVGARLSLAASASGTVAVAHSSPPMRQRWRDAGVPLPSEASLALARKRGFAAFKPRDRHQIAAVAAPVFDAVGQCVAVLAISGPPSRFDHARCGPIAVAAARRLGKELGRP